MSPAARSDDRPWPRATTLVAGVIGDPIRHSLSPAILNAAFEAAGLDWAYVAFEVPAGATGHALDGVRALGIAGLSVTMPHKTAAADLVDELTPVARRLGAVNCIVNRDGRLVGDNTDGGGFLDALAAGGVEPGGRRVAVVGAGGAARAVIDALGAAGAEVTVIARRAEQARTAAALAPGGRVGDVDAVVAAEVVVNATPVGMGGDPGLPLDPDLLQPHQSVVDLVYHPHDTPLLRAARERDLVAIGGLGMLVHQAARAFSVWTGEEAPVSVLSAAASAALGHLGAGG